MEIQYLEYFVTLAELLNFNRAAEKRHVSQPALSAQIKKLEEILECQLFYRSKRHVQLTPEGEKLLPKAKGILAEIHSMEDLAGQLRDPLRGKVRVGFSALLSLCRTFCAVKNIQSKYPNLDLTFEEDDSGRLVERLKRGEFDVVFLLRMDDLESDFFQYKVFEKNSLVHVVSKKHQKLQKTLRTFIAARNTGCPLGRLLDSAVKSHRFTYKSRVLANDVAIIKRMVEIGVGWSVLPESSLTREDRENFVVTILPGHPVEYVVAANKGQRSEVIVNLFVDEMKGEGRAVSPAAVKRHLPKARLSSKLPPLISSVTKPAVT